MPQTDHPGHFSIREFSQHTRREHQTGLTSGELDLLIVGGGVNGVWAALDARLRGLSVGVVEAADFGHGPSRNNSELLHGGFRYLKEWYQSPKNWPKVNSVLHLVRDALMEREVLMQIAPHLARPVPFCMPLYAPTGLGIFKQNFYRMGYWMYDRLSGAQSIKPHRMLSAAETQKMLRGIDSKQLVGGGVYYDCKMEPGRFIAEIVKAACAHGAWLLNYAKAETPIWDAEKKRVLGFQVKDGLSEERFDVRAKQILDATGPWGDNFRGRIWKGEKPSLRLSKGVHIMIKQLFSPPVACAFFTDDNRILFIIPWGEDYNYSLIGTTDTDYSGSPEDVAPDTKSMEYLVEKVRKLFPEADFHLYGNYAGLRPLIRQNSGSASTVSREHSIVAHGKSGVTSVFGGKWTTARKVAGEVLDTMFPNSKGEDRTSRLRFGGPDTERLIVDGKPVPDSDLKVRARVLNIAEDTLRHLVFNYGRNANLVMDLVQQDRALRENILPAFPFIQAEVIFSVRYEAAMRVADFLIRRSIFGRLRQRGLEAAPVVATLMAKELNWNTERQAAEIDFYQRSTKILSI